MVDFNRLRVFYYVCQDRSVGKAAAQLHITRSAVSQQIGKLEGELGVRLFLRTNRNMIPTPEAQELFALVEEFVKGLQEQQGMIERGKREPMGRLRIGAPIVFGETFVIDAVAKFKMRYSQVSFNLSFMNQPWLLSEKVLAGELDFAIIDLMDVARERVPVVTRPLIIERQILVGSETLLGSRRRRYLPYHEVIQFPFVVYLPDGEAEKLWCRRMYGRIPGKLDIVFDCQNLHAMIHAVKRGLGLGLIPAYLIEDELNAGALIKVKTKRPDYENIIGLAQAPDRRPSLAERLFIEMIMGMMKAHGKYL